MTQSARAKLYADITEIMKDSFERYGGEFPDRIGDERNIEAVSWSIRGLNRILRLLDKYEISERDQSKG